MDTDLLIENSLDVYSWQFCLTSLAIYSFLYM